MRLAMHTCALRPRAVQTPPPRACGGSSSRSRGTSAPRGASAWGRARSTGNSKVLAAAAALAPLSLAAVAPAGALATPGGGSTVAAGLAPALPLADLSTTLYNISVQADALVANELTSLSPLSFGVILVAGLLTSLSPCTLSVLPLTIGYIGGYEGEKGGAGGSSLAVSGVAFSAGLATTLAILGVAAATLGKAYGQLPLGDGLPIAVSLLAIVMGLNLLEVVSLRLPSFGESVDVRGLEVPSAVRAYLAGLLFALAASPCSTPVLATLLGYVAQTRDPVLGGGLLLAYTSGYVAPLLVAASFTGALKNIMSLRGTFAWITPASGALLLAGGTYTLLSRAIPA